MQCFVSFAAWYCNLFKKFSKLAARYFATIDSLFIFWEAGTTYFSYINIKLLLPFRLIAYSYIMLVVVLLVLMMAEWCWWWCFGDCGGGVYNRHLPDLGDLPHDTRDKPVMLVLVDLNHHFPLKLLSSP